MEVSFYLKRPNGDTPTVIYSRVCYAGFQMKYYTAEKILPEYWNKAKQRVKEIKKYPEYPEFNRRLDVIETQIKTVLRRYVNDKNEYPTPKTLKRILDETFKLQEQSKKIDFLSFFTTFIQECKEGVITHAKTGKRLTIGTIKSYHVTLSNVRNYEKNTRSKVDFNSIDLNFYSSFNKYLSERQKQSLNTIGKHIKVIKTIMNEATERGINTNLVFRSRKFVTVSEEADTIYLTEGEINAISGLDLSTQGQYHQSTPTPIRQNNTFSASQAKTGLPKFSY